MRTNAPDSLMTSRVVFAGDEILEINGTDVRNKSIDDVCDMMASLSGTLTFLIVPGQEYAAMPPADKLVSHSGERSPCGSVNML